MNEINLLFVSESDLLALINKALRKYASPLQLSYSPLAHSKLIEPALILDPRSPTEIERGNALRVVLRWAVSRLAPDNKLTMYSMKGTVDDETWSQPDWQFYNLLRYQHIEPLNSDVVEDVIKRDVDDKKEGGRIYALRSLIGLPTNAKFNTIRQKAITEVVHLVQEQLRSSKYTSEIKRLATEEIVSDLQKNKTMYALLDIAATFRTPFPLKLLTKIVDSEKLTRVVTSSAIDRAIDNHYLARVQKDDPQSLWQVSPALQTHFYRKQSPHILSIWHKIAASYYEKSDTVKYSLEIAWYHIQTSKQTLQVSEQILAAKVLSENEEIIRRLEIEALRNALVQLNPAEWLQEPATDIKFKIFFLQGKVHFQLKELTLAREVYQKALALDGLTGKQKGQIYRRLGKVEEESKQLEALRYYDQALELLEEYPTEHAAVLKDKGWVHIHRREWELAKTTLKEALAVVTPKDWKQKGKIHSALASMYRNQGQFNLALEQAKMHCFCMEQIGDLELLAKAKANLALVYAKMKETKEALAIYDECLKHFQSLNNKENVATTLHNIGATYAEANPPQLTEAINFYYQSLSLREEVGNADLPLAKSQLYADLADAYHLQGEIEQARAFWQLGYALVQNFNLEGELAWYKEFQADNPDIEFERSTLPTFPDEELANLRWILDLAQDKSKVTNKMLQDESVSKAAATRYLRELSQKGLLLKQGQGRSTKYVLTDLGRVVLDK